jgi:hypothetical protein
VFAVLPLLLAEIVIVIALLEIEVTLKELPLLIEFIFLSAVALPSTLTLTLPKELKTNPVGADKIIVPNPISPGFCSVRIGPVRVVHVPELKSSAEIDPPPVAGVIFTGRLASEK